MQKNLILATVMASLAMTACSTTTSRTGAQAPGLGGGSYLVGHFPGVPSIDGAPAIEADEWGPLQFKQLQSLDYACHLQMDPQIPGAASQIGGMMLKFGVLTGIGGGVGTALGAISAFTGVGFSDYLKYGGLAAAGSGAGSGAAAGWNQYELAKRYVQYACMQGFAARAAQKPGGFHAMIVPWAGPGKARALQMPTTTVGVDSEDIPAPKTEPATPLPPPL